MLHFLIEVDLNNNCDLCKNYHYSVMVWDGTTFSGWYNSGISGIERTPEKAFKVGYERYLNEIEKRKK